jgi:hypothetical protein
LEALLSNSITADDRDVVTERKRDTELFELVPISGKELADFNPSRAVVAEDVDGA